MPQDPVHFDLPRAASSEAATWLGVDDSQMDLGLFPAQQGLPTVADERRTATGQTLDRLSDELRLVLAQCRAGMDAKEYSEESTLVDPLMTALGVTLSDKRAHPQFFGQMLGMCWEQLVYRLLGETTPQFKPPVRVGRLEPCDFVLRDMAVDMKYRIGSGDSRTIRNIRRNGRFLTELGLRPHLAILRTDSMQSSLDSLRLGGWTILEGQETVDFVSRESGFDLVAWLMNHARASGGTMSADSALGAEPNLAR